MGAWKKNHSGSIAKDRLKMLLLAERIDCSPETLLMLKQDVARAANKYVLVNEKQINIQVNGFPKKMTVTLPLQESYIRQK